MSTSTTTLEQTRPLFPVRLLNGCGVLLEKTRIPRIPLRAVDLIETAKRRCGLDDFGGGDFFEAISRLLESCRREARLSLIGRIALRSDLLHTLCLRLMMERDRQLYRGLTSQRHYSLAHLARCRPGTSSSADLGGDDTVPAYRRQ